MLEWDPVLVRRVKKPGFAFSRQGLLCLFFKIGAKVLGQRIMKVASRMVILRRPTIPRLQTTRQLMNKVQGVESITSHMGRGHTPAIAVSFYMLLFKEISNH
jgi:hypothetical protein